MRACALPLVLLATAAAFFPLSTSTDTIGPSESITTSDNQTLVSAGGVFQLGFFSPDGGAGTYLGIWYYNITEHTVVWVANRQSPVRSTPGVLRISADGRLVILDGQNGTVWSSAAPTRNVTPGATALLLDNGNFILSADGSGSDSDQSVAWQSFDYPAATLLPGMKLGVDVKAGITRNITAWRSASDPSPGDVTFKLVTGGLPQFFLLRGEMRLYTSGPWNGEILTGVPYLKSNDFTFRVVSSPDETYYSYSIGVDALLSRLVVDEAAGQVQRFVLLNGGWSNFWYYPNDPCDTYAKCGPFGYCDNTGQSQACVCLPGFEPRSPQQWSLRDGKAGCVRTTSLSCGGANASSDGFWVVKRMKLPEATNATVYPGMTLDQCRQVCLSNCSCRAYAAANVSGGVSRGCVIWAVDLLDMRLFPTDVEAVYIRLAQSEIDALNAAVKVKELQVLRRENVMSSSGHSISPSLETTTTNNKRKHADSNSGPLKRCRSRSGSNQPESNSIEIPLAGEQTVAPVKKNGKGKTKQIAKKIPVIPMVSSDSPTMSTRSKKTNLASPAMSTRSKRRLSL